MTRKDSEKDAERPHYYSQFWLDVAAGRRVIGGPKPEDGTETAEPELPEPITLRRPSRTSAAPASDGHRETRPQSVVEPAYAPDVEEEEMEPELDTPDMVENTDELGAPNIEVDEIADETEFPDLDLITPEVEEEDEEEDFFDEEDEEDEEEEEEEDDWAIGRGRKKPKPGRQVKPPKPVKKPRRDTRRGF